MFRHSLRNLTVALLLVSSGPVLAQSVATSEGAAITRAETVEQRIATLHAQLQIQPAEEADWSIVAQTMRDNAANLEQLAASETAKNPENMTAIEDLEDYQKFAAANLEGLERLTRSFETLYTTMPAAQKKLADQVFEGFNHVQSSGTAPRS